MRVLNRSSLDTLTAEARQTPRLRRNLNLHPSDDSCAHRLFNAIEPGSYIRPHRHLDPEKDETFLLVRGRLVVLEFADDGSPAESVVLEPGDAVDIPAGAWHTAISLATGTVFFEAKAGPYRLLTDDELAPWAPPDKAPDAASYLEDLLALVDTATCPSPSSP